LSLSHREAKQSNNEREKSLHNNRRFGV
jgi:hypothetical protein